jgi:2,3-bisphosphoglycerate-independent phosphoglycerate mutase
VPFVIKDYSGANEFKLVEIDTPGLSNVAATLINLLGYEQPAEYDASLIELS